MGEISIEHVFWLGLVSFCEDARRAIWRGIKGEVTLWSQIVLTSTMMDGVVVVGFEV